MGIVGPITTTQVPVVYDSDSNGLGGPTDMNGPEVGQIAYSQPSGDLQLQVTLNFAQPNATYQVFLVCGPAHALGCGFTTIGTLTTDGLGGVATSFTVPIAVLQATPYGPGYRNDHIDMLEAGGQNSVLTAGAINYFVCTSSGIPQAVQAKSLRASTGTGDPLGAIISPRDPHGAKQP